MLRTPFILAMLAILGGCSGGDRFQQVIPASPISNAKATCDSFDRTIGGQQLFDYGYYPRVAVRPHQGYGIKKVKVTDDLYVYGTFRSITVSLTVTARDSTVNGRQRLIFSGGDNVVVRPLTQRFFLKAGDGGFGTGLGGDVPLVITECPQ